MNFPKLTALLNDFLKIGIPGYDCMVNVGGKNVFRKWDGYSDRAAGIPMNGKELYNIYSCSKVITVSAAMQLWEKKLFNLDDEVCKYMPEFTDMTVWTPDGIVPAKRRMTIKNLFTMTAGFSYNLNTEELRQLRKDTDGRCPTRLAMKYLAKTPLLFHPGDRYEYSVCHDVLAALVEVLSGTEFNQYVTENIFKPLDMKNTSFLFSPEECKRISGQYTGKVVDGQNIIEQIPADQNTYRIGTEYASGGAGCVSTVEDYMKFLEALRTGDVILKKETIRLMTQNHLTEEQNKSYWRNATSAYGLGVRCPKAGGVYTDFGWGGAAGAYLAVDPVHDFTVYYSQHVLNSPNHEDRVKVVDKIIEDLQNN